MPRNSLYDPVSLYETESPELRAPSDSYNVSSPWRNRIKMRDRSPEDAAAAARLGLDAEEVDLTDDNFMDRPELNATQQWALRSKYSPQELKKLRDEIDADPESFGAGRFGTATAEFGGKKYKMKSMSGANTRAAANWVDHERNRMKQEAEDKKAAAASAAELAKANVPIEVAKVAAASNDKATELERQRQAHRDYVADNERTRANKQADEDRALLMGIKEAQAKRGATDIEEQQTAKQARIAEKLRKIQSEELAGLEFNPDEQRAVMTRLGAADADLAGLTEDKFLRRPSAEQAESQYANEIAELGTFLDDNWLDVTPTDQAHIQTGIGDLLKRAEQDLTPGQLQRFKQKLNATLGGRIKGGWFNSDKKRRESLRAALGM